MNDSARTGVAIAGLAVAGVSDMPDFTQERFSWEGSCWELVSDPDLDTALVRPGGSASAQEAFAARLANILRLNVGNLVVTEGASINHLVALAIAGATAEFQEAFIQNLRTNGAEIETAVVAELASNIITSGVFRTAVSGQRWEIDSSGIVMYGVDPDLGEVEVVRLGPAEGANLITVGDTTVSSSSVSTGDLSADALTVGGDDLADILAPLPRGRVVQNTYTETSNYSDRAQSRLSTNFEVEPGRRYSVHVSPFFLQPQSASAVEYKVVRSWDTLSTTWTGATLASGRSSLPDSNTHMVPGLEADLPIMSGTEPRTLYLTLMVSPASGSSTPVRMVGRDDYPVTLSVDDVGVAGDDAGSYWTAGNVTETTAPPAPVVPTKTRKTYTWAAAGYGGDIRSGEVIQGYYSGYGNRYGGWTFPSGLMASLSGAKIEKFEVYLYATHWYASAGGTASIRPNNGSYKGTTFGSTQVVSPKWPRKAGRWVTIPSSWYPSIANGTYRGVSVQTSSTSSTYYGRFTGTATKFRATYVR